MVKVSINRFVHKRINNVRRELETYAERLRKKAFKNLEEIFEIAGKIVRGEIKYQRVNGKMVHITLAQRQIWLKIAQQAAETMESLATNINEEEIKIRLNILDRLLSESTRQAREKLTKPPKVN